MYTSHGWVRYIVFTVSLSSWVLTLSLPHLHAYTVNSVKIYNALCNKTSINWKWYLVITMFSQNNIQIAHELRDTCYLDIKTQRYN